MNPPSASGGGLNRLAEPRLDRLVTKLNRVVRQPVQGSADIRGQSSVSPPVKRPISPRGHRNGDQRPKHSQTSADSVDFIALDEAGIIPKSLHGPAQQILDGIVNGCRVRTEFTKRRGQRQLPGQRQPLDTWIVRTQTVKFLHVRVGRIRKSSDGDVRRFRRR